MQRWIAYEGFTWSGKMASPRWKLVVVGMIMGIWCSLSGVSHGQESYPGGYVLIPVGRTPIVLLSTTADATIYEQTPQVFIDVQAAYRLHNNDKRQAQKLTVAFPGYAVDGPAPQGVTLTASGHEVTFREADTNWWLADVTLQPDERTSLVLKYTAPLGEGPFVTFRHPLDVAAKAWPGNLESARFTLAFSEPPNPQSWIRLTPENYKLTAESINWSFDAVDPQAPIDYLFLRPSLWERLRKARQAAVAADAPAAASIALGDVYVELASAGDDAIFDRYFPLAVAAYNLAQAKAPSDPAAYIALAGLFRQRAGRASPPDPSYLALATNQLATALENGVQDAGITETVVKDYAALIEAARQEGDFDAANTYFRRLDELATHVPTVLDNAALVDERRRLAIDWAREVLADEGPAPSRAVLEESLGPGIAQPPDAHFAHLNGLQVTTDTQLGHRRIEITAVPREGGESLVQDLQNALTAADAGAVTLAGTQPPVIQVDLSFGDAGELRQRQQRLADSLTDEPEWTALKAMLEPERLEWRRNDVRWRSQDSWNEQVSLVDVAAVLGQQAQALDQAAGNLDTTDELNVLLADLWRAEAETWRRLGENNRARFTLTLQPEPGAPIVRTWSIAAGETTTMTGSATQYRLFPYVWWVAAAYALFMMATGLLWWRRRRAVPKRRQVRTRPATNR